MNKSVIHSVFEQVAQQWPSNIALESDESHMTYKDLNSYANRIAHLLRFIGCVPGKIINVIAPASPQLVAALLSVFKAGGIYLPVDLSFSRKRLRQIFEDTFDGITVINAATFENYLELVNELNIKEGYLIVLGHTGEIGLYRQVDRAFIQVHYPKGDEWEANPPLTVEGDSSNYIFYTSGSTGEGKAIVGAHAGLSHFIHWEIREFGIDHSFKISQLAQVTFDASLRDIFVALISGGTLCIPGSGTRNDPARLLDWIMRSEISLVHCVPSLFRILTRELLYEDSSRYNLSRIRYVLMAGELLYAKDILNWRMAAGKEIQLVNFYGPTETTLIKTFFRIKDDYTNPAHIIPVGVPIGNTSIAIIKDEHICRGNEIGEIYIKTPFATKGYYKNEELTNQYFVQNPLLKDKKDIVYKTGDLGRYLADGNIEVLGRLDSQVKVNGIRVELIEIELAMLENDQITGAVVKPHRTDDNLVSLIAYYTGVKTDPVLIRESLEKLLNPNLLPSYYIHLDEFPLTINGKIDKKALPVPEDVIIGASGSEAPVGEMETRLSDLWMDILGLNRIGRDISFFSVGGHSLRAIQLVSRIHKEFGVNLKIADVFAHRTIKELASLISRRLKTEYIQIEPVGIQSGYDLSSGQRRLWVLSQFEDGNIAYNMPGVYIFEGNLHRSSMVYAFNQLIERHEILRTVFREDSNGEVKQVIRPVEASQFDITYRDVRSEPEKEEVVRELIRAEFIKPFDLSTGPLVRAGLIQAEDNKWIFTYIIHHIISDGWSMGILMNELLFFYNQHNERTTHTLQPLGIQYKDYAAWQQKWLKGDDLDEHKQYWLGMFNNELPILSLLGDKVRPAIKTYNGGTVGKHINPALSKKLELLIEQQGSTLFMGLLAMVDTLLYKYTGQNDIVIGSPVVGREFSGLEDQIGFYLNTLPLRLQFDEQDSFLQLLENVKEVTLGAFEHRIYPFDELVNELHLRRDMSRSALFDVMIVLQNATSHQASLTNFGGMEVSRYQGAAENISKFDLTFNFEEVAGEIQLGIVYNSDIYNADTIVRMADHFEQLLNAVAERPSVPLAELDYLTSGEKEKILEEFNDTAASYQEPRTLTDLFEQQVEQHPDKIALVFLEKTMTYRELNEQSNKLAAYLKIRYNIKKDDLIGLCLERNEWMVVAIMACLKSGGAYVPIDPAYPQERIDYMLEDSSCKAVIDDRELEKFLKEYDRYSPLNPASAGRPEDLVYVIYTSGSTGRPKGCMLEHRGLVNRLSWMWKQYDFTEEDIILQKTAYTFDVSVWELFLPLCFGAKMVLCQKEDSGSPERILSLIEGQGITCLHFVPGMLSAFITSLFDDDNIGGKLTSLRRVITSGEALPLATVRNWYEKVDIPVHNLYGPTEASVDVTYYPTSGQEAKMLIGKPIWNTQIFILDGAVHLTPVGVVGELCIGGVGLARGYLNKPGLTEEKFIPNPFRKGERMYRTGDLARWREDGNIEFIGRADDQVKIRGYRIELGEIESVLLGYPDINSAVVVARPDLDGDMRLIAYLTSNGILSMAGLRAHLSKHLPVYMLPAFFVQIDKLPLSSSGKVDRKKLPDPDAPELTDHTHYIAPRNQSEEILSLIWQEVLGIGKVDINDDFFEIGGHSLKVIRLASLIHKTIGVKIALGDLFSHAVLKEQARLIDLSVKTAYQEILPAAEQFDYPMTPSQRRLWILSQTTQGNIAYIMAGAYIFEGDLNEASMELAFYSLLDRHEILRTLFKENEEGEIRQFIQLPDSKQGRMAFLDVRGNSAEKIDQLVRQEFVTPFDLSSGPLIRTQLLRVENNKWIFTYAMHHIISDGWSMNILINELLLFYNAYNRAEKTPLAPLRIQYKDYAVWLQEYAAGRQWEQHREYWLGQLKHGIPSLKISRKQRPPQFSYRGDSLAFLIEKDLAAGIADLTSRYNGTPFISLICSLKLLLYKYTGNSNILIGTSLAGRHHYDLEDQIGLYLNNLPLITGIQDDLSIKELYSKIKNTVLNALQHQAYPLDLLINETGYRTDTSRSGIFNVWMEYYAEGISHAPKEPNGLTITPLEFGSAKSYFDLTFDFKKVKDEIGGSITYNTDLFDYREIVLMKERFIQLLVNLTGDRDEDRKIRDIGFLIPEEAYRLSGSQLKFDMEESF